MNARILPAARKEIRAAVAYYEARRQGLGDDFLDEFSRRFDEISDQPLRFPKDDCSGKGREYRYALLERFPYRVVYRVFAGEILVVAVAHTSRKADYWKRRK